MSNSRPLWQQVLLHWLPWLLWMGLIFYLSDRPKQESMEMSGWFTLVFQWMGYSYEELEAMHVVTVIRKLAHFSVYFILSFWTIRLERYYLGTRGFPWWAVLWCLLYAISDEVHQIYVAGRGPHVIDVLIDLFGAATAGWLSQFHQKKYIYRNVDHKMY